MTCRNAELQYVLTSQVVATEKCNTNPKNGKVYLFKTYILYSINQKPFFIALQSLYLLLNSVFVLF